MAFTKDQPYNERYWPLHFYTAAGVLANSSISDSLTLAKRFQINEIRIHFSVAVVSVIDFMINVSSVLGSAYNTKLISQALLNLQDVFIYYSQPLQFNSDDHINFATSTISIANWYGIEVWGWGVVEGA